MCGRAGVLLAAAGTAVPEARGGHGSHPCDGTLHSRPPGHWSSLWCPEQAPWVWWPCAVRVPQALALLLCEFHGIIACGRRCRGRCTSRSHWCCWLGQGLVKRCRAEGTKRPALAYDCRH